MDVHSSFFISLLILVVGLSRICDCACSPGLTTCDWAPWDSWSSCSESCGGGIQRRSRGLCCRSDLVDSDIEDACIKECDLPKAYHASRQCNKLCYNGGTYGREGCYCRNEYYGRCCQHECPGIEDCEKRYCAYGYSDLVCKKCSGQGGDKFHSIYWPSSDKETCKSTCSYYKERHCWPGYCSERDLSNCYCESGFKLKGSGTCDLDTPPDLLTCRIVLTDSRGEMRRTTMGSSSTGCWSETDTYINVQPSFLSINLQATFQISTPSSIPNYISGTHLGIVKGWVKLVRQSTSGYENTITKKPFQGGHNCRRTLSSSSPSTHVNCKIDVSPGTTLLNGYWLCAKFEVFSGGYYSYTNFAGYTRGTNTFEEQARRKTLCFRYDNVPPVHCSVRSSSCSSSTILNLSARRTKSADISVHVSGWLDPHPWRQSQASGIDFYKLEVYGMKHLDLDTLTIDYTTAPFKSGKLRGSSHNIAVTLTEQPAMYATYLEVHDIAGNVRYARRFLYYDNTSSLEIKNDTHILVVSASNETNYHWQIHHGSIQVKWTDRYFNNLFIYNNYLVHIKADANVGGKYDQHTGLFPVSGTTNVNGVTSFKYQWTLNNITGSPWKNVPDFTSQSLSLDRNVKDGETYEVWIMAEDIMLNSVVESVVVHIDKSVASIADTWLVREGVSQIFVHNNTDLSKMVLQFRVFDVHSGIRSVTWILGTSDEASDLGSGALPVIKLKTLEDCPSGDTCYCPSVGPCEYQNYTLTLNSLIEKNTHTGQHNREYYFTLSVINGAMLKSFDKLDILVDESPPQVGFVQEGGAGGPDIDYTSDNNLVISWDGFIDHESGIKQYIVGLASRCLVAGELKDANSPNITFRETQVQTTSVRFPVEGRYFTSIMALNNAHEPSPVVCSDGIVFDLTSPIIENINLHQATATSSLHCVNDKPWLINLNLTMTPLPLTSTCLDKCKWYSSEGNLHFPIIPGDYMANTTADNFCSELDYFNNTNVYIPFDRIILKWSINELESQIQDTFIGFGFDSSSFNAPDLAEYEPTHGKTVFSMHRTGLGGSTEFFIFIKVNNKAGLSTLATLGPVLIDDTPPVIHKSLKPEVVGDYVRVTWDEETITDPEQDNSQFKVKYRAVMGKEYVTRTLETPRTLRKDCQSQGFADCVQHPLRSLQLQDSELGKPCLLELYVHNSAGLFTTVTTDSFLLPSRFPPGPATVFDLDPASIDSLVDVDFHRNKTVCIHWYGFAHHRNVTLQIGIGSAKGLDDVKGFSDITIIENNVVCVSSDSLIPFRRFFASVQAISSGGSSVSSSDGFVIVSDIPDILLVNDGSGCQAFDDGSISMKQIHINSSAETFSINSHLQIGFLYRLQVQNVNEFEGFILRSDDIVTHATDIINSSYEITFFPLTSKPVFEMISLTESDFSIRLSNCVEDIDYQSSTATYAVNWRERVPYSNFVTHYLINIFVSVCNGSNNENCMYVVKESGVKVSGHSRYIFTKLHLKVGVKYAGSVTPCFEHVCLRGQLSDGFWIASKPVIGHLVSKVEDESEDCTNVSFGLSRTECRETAENFDIASAIQVAILRSDSDNSPVIPWTRMQSTSTLQTNLSLKLPIHSYQKLFSCVRVFCPSGHFNKKCVELTLNPYAKSYHDHALFELPSDDRKLVNVEDLLHSKHLGTRLRILHEMDLDFVKVSSRISAVVTNSASHNINWYMMRGKPEIPIEDCDLDVSCIGHKTSLNGHVKFGKITFEEAVPYYVCANASARGDAAGFTVCGNGFVVDDSPPIAGTVSITNSVAGFITDASHLYITWSGFRDSLQESRYSHQMQSFTLAIGDYPHGGNIMPWTRVGDRTSYLAYKLTIENGREYFATVRAEDRVGHMTESVSPGVVADLTPPLCGDIRVEGLKPHRNMMTATSLHIHLKNFQDPESSIHSIYLSVYRSANASNVYRLVKPRTDFVDIKVDDSFNDGHQYQIHIQLTNSAGLHSICTSRTFILDNSPPQAGVVRDGSHKIDADHQTDSSVLECNWLGFSDSHSGIRNYKVGLGTSSDMVDVRPLQSVGLQTNYTWVHNFVPGVKYYSIVEACNGVELCTTIWSDGIIMDGSPPVAGVVIVGHADTHHKYHGHRSYVYSHWVGFEDAETSVHHFECCIGRGNKYCDVMNFTNTALLDSYLATGLDLPLSVPLYVTVRAFNPVGLSVEATSPSFTVDETPPQVIEQPVFISTSSDETHSITAQWDNSLLFVTWKFSDDESPIHKHVLTFRTHHESSVAQEIIELGPQQSHLIVFGKDNRLRSGDRYQVSVSSCNAASLCTTSHSRDILIDSTPPFLGGFKSPLNWETIESNGSKITTVNLTWYGFVDIESGISYYQLSIGSTYEGAELTRGTVKVSHNADMKEQSVTLELYETIPVGDTVVLSIFAVNNIGLQSHIGKVTVTVVSTHHKTDERGLLEIQRHSCDVHYCTKDCTCAVVGWKCRPPPKPMTCKDMANSTSVPDVYVYPGTFHQSPVPGTTSLSCIAGHWEVTGNTSANISRYEWSIGLQDEQVGVGIFNITEESIWYDVGKQTEIVHCLPYNRILEHGEDYFLYVRAWYTETDFKEFTSPSIRVDHTPPAVRRGRILKDSDHTCQNDFDIYNVNQSTVYACWKGLFQESQTTIREFTVWAGVTIFGTDLLSLQSVGLSTNVSLPVEDIIPGTKYYVGVRAVNTLNMSSTVISDGFLLDADHPLGGHVFNTENHKNRLAQSENTSIGVSWNGFQDHHSSIRRYLVQVRNENSSDVISEVNVTLRNSLLIDNIILEHGKQYIVSVVAVDFAGHFGKFVQSQPVLIDTTPPAGFICQNFTEISPINVTYKRKDVAPYVINYFIVDLQIDGDTHFQVRLNVESDHFDKEFVQFSIGTLFVETPFILQQNQTVHSATSLYSAEYQFTLVATNNASSRLEISFESKGSFKNANVIVESCINKETTFGSGTITTKQLTPSLLSICVRVMDPESGVQNIHIGVGTTRDGYQIQTLRPAVARFHELLDVSVPHGTPVYTTVIAENQAGLKSYFLSDPITMDHTPPLVQDVKTKLKYIFNETENLVDVQVLASWFAEERESQLAFCSCSLGYKRLTFDILDWTFCTSLTSCQVYVPNETHGLRFYLNVQCGNTVELNTVVSSEEMQILLEPPSTNGSFVDIVVQNRYSQQGGEMIQSSKSSLKFQWEWPDSKAVNHYQCRAEGMTGWVNTSLRYCVFSGLRLKDGERYTAQVRAVDLREQTSDVVSAGVTVDSTTPQLTGLRASVLWKNDAITLYYGFVFRHLVGQLIFTINVGSKLGYSDYMRQMTTSHEQVTIGIPPPTSEIHVTITAVAAVGTYVTYTDRFTN